MNIKTKFDIGDCVRGVKNNKAYSFQIEAIEIKVEYNVMYVPTIVILYKEGTRGHQTTTMRDERLIVKDKKNLLSIM